MKLLKNLTALLSALLLLGAIASVHAQAEKVKQKAKDLKKNVEGGQTTTNKPPKKTPPAPPVPPAPPQKPAK